MNTGRNLRSDTADTIASGTALHNMSAPPRSKMTVKPLRTETRAMAIRSGHAASSSSSGLAWVMRIDLDRLIEEHLPDFHSWIADGELRPGRSAPAPGDATLPPTGSVPVMLSGDHHLRLRCCVVIARLPAGIDCSVSNARVEELRKQPHEALCDELRTLNAAIDPTPLDLPALGMMTRPDGTDRAWETNPARVFYALSRLSGNTFVRSGSAMIAGDMSRNITFDLWLPA
jgi:hypothetical protein